MKTGTLRPVETTGSAGNRIGQTEQKDSARGNPRSPLKTENWERKTFLCGKTESDWLVARGQEVQGKKQI
jgi:hypothetical protein